jgi:hypothetical protein
MNKTNKHGHNYQYKMDIKREIMFRKRCYWKENLLNVVINHINKRLVVVRIVFIFVNFLKLILFLWEYVLYEIQNIFMNKAKRHMIKNNKKYIVLLIFY